MPIFKKPSRAVFEETLRYLACGQFGGLLEVYHYEGPNSGKFIGGGIVFAFVVVIATVLYLGRTKNMRTVQTKDWS